MRLHALVALSPLFFFAPLSSVFAADDFSGAWVAWLCPGEVARDSGRCSNFVLELHQKDDQLCGAHFFSTAGAERIDEGMAPSVLGRIDDDTANAVAVSTRSGAPVKVRVEMKKVGGGLRWLRLENPAGDYLLPQATRLIKSKSKTLFAPVFEQELKAACSSVFVMAAQNAAKKEQAESAGDGRASSEGPSTPATPGGQTDIDPPDRPSIKP